MIFKDIWLLTLIPIALAIVFVLNRRTKKAALLFPSTGVLATLKKTWKVRLSSVPFILRLGVIIFFLVALAGPRSLLEDTRFSAEGIDIMLAIDASGSMAAEDFEINGRRQNRLHVVKNVVDKFIDERTYDRLGLIAFAGYAYTVSPLTMDHTWLKENLERVDLNLIKDGTAIGSAINSSLARLRKSEAKSKVIILLTDGMNNAGNTDPVLAAKAAQALGVKIYAIGAGSKGKAPFPVKDIWGRQRYRMVQIEIDEKTLKEIAGVTGGRYFRATDTKSLQEIYNEIDKLEKTKIETIGYKEFKELFPIFLLSGIAALFIEQLLSQFFLVRIP